MWYGMFCRGCEQAQWSFVYELPTVDAKVDYLNNIILAIKDIYITDNFKYKLKVKNRTYLKYRKTRKLTDLAYYKANALYLYLLQGHKEQGSTLGHVLCSAYKYV